MTHFKGKKLIEGTKYYSKDYVEWLEQRIRELENRCADIEDPDGYLAVARLKNKKSNEELLKEFGW
jgi:hypothetical protein